MLVKVRSVNSLRNVRFQSLSQLQKIRRNIQLFYSNRNLSYVRFLCLLYTTIEIFSSLKNTLTHAYCCSNHFFELIYCIVQGWETIFVRGPHWAFNVCLEGQIQVKYALSKIKMKPSRAVRCNLFA